MCFFWVVFVFYFANSAFCFFLFLFLFFTKHSKCKEKNKKITKIKKMCRQTVCIHRWVFVFKFAFCFFKKIRTLYFICLCLCFLLEFYFILECMNLGKWVNFLKICNLFLDYALFFFCFYVFLVSLIFWKWDFYYICKEDLRIESWPLLFCFWKVIKN